jgi:hypothetical protein
MLYFCTMRRLVVFVCVLSSLLSCEKTINIEPAIKEPLLVVEGTIENGQPPVIILSKSINYFSTIDPAIVAASIVKNAEVTLSNGSRTIKLKEYSRPIGGMYSLVYYSADTANPSSNMIGELGKKYTLNISAENKTYSAETTIPLLSKKIDSLWWIPAPRNADTNRVVAMVKVTDPAGFGNYIRYFTRVNRQPFYPGANSVFDDQIVDGTTYSLQVEQGIDRNDPPQLEDYGFFRRGDTLTVKFANIDKSTFDFYRTLEFSYQSIGNPFSSPTTVVGNISNGALGAFSGYAAQYISLIIPK